MWLSSVEIQILPPWEPLLILVATSHEELSSYCCDLLNGWQFHLPGEEIDPQIRPCLSLHEAHYRLRLQERFLSEEKGPLPAGRIAHLPVYQEYFLSWRECFGEELLEFLR